MALGGVVNACGGHLGSREGATAGTGGAAGAGGASDARGEGGTVGSGGTVGTGGAMDAGGGGSGGGFGEPACLPKVAQGAACTADGSAVLLQAVRPPKAPASKSETCRRPAGSTPRWPAARYDPTRDYSCYRIPTVANAGLRANGATGAVRRGVLRSCPSCRPCNSRGGIAGGMYIDAGGAAKIGYCVCQPPDAEREADLELRERHRLAVPGRRRLWHDPGRVASAAPGRQRRHGRRHAGAAAVRPARLSEHGHPKSATCTPTDIQFCYKTCGARQPSA